MINKETIGVILLNLGGPDSIQAVRPFLYNLFSDRQIIRLGPPFMQKPLAWLISTIRSKKTKQYYRQIGGKSPIAEITNAQAKALEEVLNSSLIPHPSSFNFGVYTGMRYWQPLIEDVVKKIYSEGIRKLVALSLYPQYSITTTGSSLVKFNEAASLYEMETYCISSWFDHPLYIDALVDVIKKGVESFSQESNPKSDVHILFSAHSLPQKIVEEGDPYVDQIMGTISGVTKRMPSKWHLSYQSKSGPVKWLEPSTEDKIHELAEEGVRNILVVPVSFVSDHIETLYEIDVLYKKFAENIGVTLKRTASLNTHPLFVNVLKDLVQNGIREAGWT